MSAELYEFAEYRLDATNRRLERQGARVELASRYLDVLILLVRRQGSLVPKQRFIEDAWRGVPVTDEALTQAIRSIRKQLGDDAARPRFIETVPKHGYRFIAQVVEPVSELEERDPEFRPRPGPAITRADLRLWRGGMLGGIVAGVIGGVIYGLAEASGPLSGGASGLSMVLVYVCMTTVIAFLGGAGVSLGIVIALRMQMRLPFAAMLGGAAGGLVIGAVVKLIGVDAFLLLFGTAPADMTGALEGLLLGAAIGLATALSFGQRKPSRRRGALIGGVATGAVGALIPLMGGHMLGGSLELLTLSFPNSRLQFDQIGLFFGENGLGPIAQVVTGALEGTLFGASIVAGMAIARERIALGPERRPDGVDTPRTPIL